MPDSGHNEAYLLSRAEHYGTQTADTISDLEATVTGYNLNEFTGWVHAVQDAGAQTVNGVKTLGDRLEMAGNKITTVGTPSANSGDAANSAYVDSGSTYLVRTAGDQAVNGTKHFSDAVVDQLKRGTGVSAGTNRGHMKCTDTWAIGHNDWHDVPFDDFRYFIEDNGSLNSGITWTLPLTGVWMLSACITWPDAGESYYAAMRWLQSSTVIAQTAQKSWNDDKMSLMVARYFSGGSTCKLQVYHDDASSLVFPADSVTTPCWVSACYVG